MSTNRKPQIRNITKEPTADSIQYIVYDLSIEDVEQRRQQAQIYPSGIKLGRAIGIKPNKIRQYTNPAEKKRFYSSGLKKSFAIRVYCAK